MIQKYEGTVPSSCSIPINRCFSSQGPAYVLHSNVILLFLSRQITNFGNLGLRTEQELLCKTALSIQQTSGL